MFGDEWVDDLYDMNMVLTGVSKLTGDALQSAILNHFDHYMTTRGLGQLVLDDQH